MLEPVVGSDPELLPIYTLTVPSAKPQPDGRKGGKEAGALVMPTPGRSNPGLISATGKAPEVGPCQAPPPAHGQAKMKRRKSFYSTELCLCLTPAQPVVKFEQLRS